jgi:hypothetical protein
MVGDYQATHVPMLDLHELAGGKLAALLSRTASRDLFGTCQLLRREDLNLAKLRLAFVLHGGANRRDWRTVSLDDVKMDVAELRGQLLPTLRIEMLPSPENFDAWGQRLVSECRDRLRAVLPLTSEEREFLNGLNDRGEILPELLTDNARTQAMIRSHPALLWKARNVREHRGSLTEEQGQPRHQAVEHVFRKVEGHSDGRDHPSAAPIHARPGFIVHVDAPTSGGQPAGQWP